MHINFIVNHIKLICYFFTFCLVYKNKHLCKCCSYENYTTNDTINEFFLTQFYSRKYYFVQIKKVVKLIYSFFIYSQRKLQIVIAPETTVDNSNINTASENPF